VGRSADLTMMVLRAVNEEVDDPGAGSATIAFDQEISQAISRDEAI
jgi:hypothetical protein